jgi:hypothetical protein
MTAMAGCAGEARIAVADRGPAALETTTESLEDLERYHGPEYARQLYG